ncbi:hypothetical protein D3C84_1135080 [compost metagenome]
MGIDRLAVVQDLEEGGGIAIGGHHLGALVAGADHHHLVGLNLDGALGDDHVFAEGDAVVLHLGHLLDRIHIDLLGKVGLFGAHCTAQQQGREGQINVFH